MYRLHYKMKDGYMKGNKFPEKAYINFDFLH